MKIKAIAFFLLLTTFVRAQQPDSLATKKVWSLQDCISYALENNIDIASSVDIGKTKAELDYHKTSLFKIQQELGDIKITLKNLIDYLDD